jgi:hypothetical protein
LVGKHSTPTRQPPKEKSKKQKQKRKTKSKRHSVVQVAAESAGQNVTGTASST